jgi:hypothetical protein
LNQKCYNEIMQIYAGIGRKEIWAIKSEFQWWFRECSSQTVVNFNRQIVNKINIIMLA